MSSVRNDMNDLGRHPRSGDNANALSIRGEEIVVLPLPRQEVHRFQEEEQRIRDTANTNLHMMCELVPRTSHNTDREWWQAAAKNKTVVSAIRSWQQEVLDFAAEWGWARVMPDIKRTLEQIETILDLTD